MKGKLRELAEMVREAYRAGFIAACKWPEPVSQDVDSSAYNKEFNDWSFSVREKHAAILDAERIEADERAVLGTCPLHGDDPVGDCRGCAMTLPEKDFHRPHSPDTADSGRVVVSVFRDPDEEQIAETVYNINRKTDKPTVDAFLVAQVWSNMMDARPIKAVEATLAAQGQGEPDPMEAIVQHCMVTEAVSPDSADPYGTISRVIDWHQANTAPPAVVPEGYVLVPREPTLDMRAAHQIHGDTSDWWNAVIEAAAPSAPSEEVE